MDDKLMQNINRGDSKQLKNKKFKDLYWHKYTKKHTKE